jgi:hypothetical protein
MNRLVATLQLINANKIVAAVVSKVKLSSGIQRRLIGSQRTNGRGFSSSSLQLREPKTIYIFI